MPAAAGHIASNREGCGNWGSGKPPWIEPTTLTPAASSPMTAEAAMPTATASSGAGDFGMKRLAKKMTARVPTATARVVHESSGACAKIENHVAEEALLVDVDAEQLGHLVDDDDEAHPRLESGQHRFRNEIGQEAHAQDSRADEHQADQHGERGGGGKRIEPGVVAQRFADRRRAQDRDRRGGADGEQTRRTEHGVHDHRHQRREQARLHRQLRDGRVGERLRHDDRGGCQSREQVRGKCLAPIARLDNCFFHSDLPSNHGRRCCQNVAIGLFHRKLHTLLIRERNLRRNQRRTIRLWSYSNRPRTSLIISPCNDDRHKKSGRLPAPCLARASYAVCKPFISHLDDF